MKERETVQFVALTALGIRTRNPECAGIPSEQMVKILKENRIANKKFSSLKFGIF